MKLSSMTSTAFGRNPGRAKHEADKQPLVITEHGGASYVLVTYADFTANWKKSKSLLEALADNTPDSGKDFEPDRLDPPGAILASDTLIAGNISANGVKTRRLHRGLFANMSQRRRHDFRCRQRRDHRRALILHRRAADWANEAIEQFGAADFAR